MAVSVLIVEDDRNIAELLQMYLEKEGYAVTVANDGGQGLAKYRAIKPDLVLLDVMMPVMDGWSVCKAIRAEAQTPIIMLTAKGETDDKVAGLKSGADDYVTKPFEMKEVLARIEAVLRRTSGVAAEKKARRLTFEKLVIDMDAFELLVDGKKIDTPPKEMELLYYLASSPNRVYTRNQLLDEVWGFDYFGDSRTVDVHVKRLREKLEVVQENWSLKPSGAWAISSRFYNPDTKSACFGRHFSFCHGMNFLIFICQKCKLFSGYVALASLFYYNISCNHTTFLRCCKHENILQPQLFYSGNHPAAGAFHSGCRLSDAGEPIYGGFYGNRSAAGLGGDCQSGSCLFPGRKTHQ